MHKCRQAVILAAGMGKRLGDQITIDHPKPLFKFNNKTLLERNIDTLLNVGVEEIIVIGGYKIEMLEPIINKYKNVILIKNHFYKEYSTMQSLSLAEGLIDKCCIQTEGDFIAEPRGFEALLTSSDNSVICSEQKKKNGVAVPVFENGKFKSFSRDMKNINSDLFLNYVGPAHYTKDLLISMRKHDRENNNTLLFEEALSKSVHDDNFNLSFIYVNNFDYLDLNTYEDIEMIQQLANRLDEEVS